MFTCTIFSVTFLSVTQMDALLQQIELAKDDLERCRGGRERVLRLHSLISLHEQLIEAYCDAALGHLLGGDVAWSGRWLFHSPTTLMVEGAMKLAKMGEVTALCDLLRSNDTQLMLYAQRSQDAATRGTLILKAVFKRVLVNSILAVCYFYLPGRGRVALGYSSAACDLLASCCPSSPEDLVPCALRCNSSSSSMGWAGRAARIVSILSSHGSILAQLGKLPEALTTCQLAVSLAKQLKDADFADRMRLPRRPAGAGIDTRVTELEQPPFSTSLADATGPSLLALWTNRSTALLCSLTLFNVSHAIRLMQSAAGRAGRAGEKRRLVHMERDTLASCASYCSAAELGQRDPFVTMVEARLHEALQIVAREEDEGEREAMAASAGLAAEMLITQQQRQRYHAVDRLGPLRKTRQDEANATLQHLRGAVGLMNQRTAMRRAGSAGRLRREVEQLPLSQFSSWLND